MRIDKFLVLKGYVTSRNKASELIKNNKIKVNGKIVNKTSFEVNEDDKIEILEKKIYVSRAACKLKNYLEKFNINFNGKTVLDIGASTGGFSEVSLEKGAEKVVAVDVGTNQLAEKLKNNPKIESYENTDFRNFEYKEKFDVIVSDVSFISLNKLIKKIDKFAKKDIILLFKPQFEVGINIKRDKKGVVLDKIAIEKARKNFEKNCKNLNWKLIRNEESSIKGKEGNIEYIYHFVKESND
ncbi:23S rRNA (cytidine1920-2'-O)/16S rRNA (cytidine1409-2'-O)-methyltransferase [Lebetimonas natsushimae]|uniref:23S rRNA (Cytidine1920-2'-O)/16S rRNA (Cytidine1409-2'-O)-methyltransferase n=1 Tax=Lebetimonas natsushimae TaxID=1936991 RepID=A0A292YDS5_9BACT|nr:TlyA family RNA methyltransferase [Lebetimonas natsushimae]GAX87521.1 23S rRNA (cytidine1920-2'-O)/16S rRNA (cytidine1409-2'-O)-methyltransferase [Lebetimonas natsushimae]